MSPACKKVSLFVEPEFSYRLKLKKSYMLHLRYVCVCSSQFTIPSLDRGSPTMQDEAVEAAVNCARDPESMSQTMFFVC